MSSSKLLLLHSISRWGITRHFSLSSAICTLLVVSFVTEISANEQPIDLACDLVAKTQYHSYLDSPSAQLDADELLSYDEFSGRIKFFEQISTTLKEHKFFEFKDTTDPSERSVVVAMHNDSLRLLDFHLDSTEDVQSIIHWPLVWLNEALSIERPMLLTEDNILTILLEFFDIYDRPTAFPLKILGNWKEVELSSKLPDALKKAISKPTIRTSVKGYEITLYIMDITGELVLLKIHVSDNIFTLQSTKVLGKFAEQFYFD